MEFEVVGVSTNRLSLRGEARGLTAGQSVTIPTDAADRLAVHESNEGRTSIMTPQTDPVLVRASEITFNEGLMRLAAVHGKTVTFRYAKGNGAVIEQRTLKPSEVKEVAGHVTFTGYDPDRDEPRAYRIDRMKGEVSIA